MTRITRHDVRAFVGPGHLSWLAGCSALSPYSHMTKLDLTLTATDQLNLDINGQRRRWWCACTAQAPGGLREHRFLHPLPAPEEALSQDMVA
jgi:type VI secretion system protein VasD